MRFRSDGQNCEVMRWHHPKPTSRMAPPAPNLRYAACRGPGCSALHAPKTAVQWHGLCRTHPLQGSAKVGQNGREGRYRL
jgi:hypothetical protein